MTKNGAEDGVVSVADLGRFGRCSSIEQGQVSVRRVPRSGLDGVSGCLSVGLLCLVLVGCDGGSEDVDSSREVGQSSQSGQPAMDPLHKTGSVGCYSPAFSGVSGSLFGCGLLSRLGNPQVDSYYEQEWRNVQQFFGMGHVPLWVFDECSPGRANAYAVPQPQFVLHGAHFAQRLTRITGGDWRIALSSVTAHEYGHQVQFQYGWQDTGEPTARRTELEADFFAGYYIGLAKNLGDPSWVGFLQILHAIGDHNFNHPSHHGTPVQRCRAGLSGMAAALVALQAGQPASWQMLHRAFGTLYENGTILRDIGGCEVLEGVAGGSVGAAVDARRERLFEAYDSNGVVNLFPYHG